MYRPPYEYTSPLNNLYPTESSPTHHRVIPGTEMYHHDNPQQPELRYSTVQQSNYLRNVTRPDPYEGSNDNTLRAEERNWYLETHINNHTNETLPRTSKDQRKNEEQKKQQPVVSADIQRTATVGRPRRKEDRCSCECWPTGTPEMPSSVDREHVPQSAVDMVASYGVYQNPQDDDDVQAGFVQLTRNYHQPQQQGVVVNESGNSSVVPRVNNNNNLQNGGFFSKFCGNLTSSNATSSPGIQQDDCWINCCRPAIFLLLLVLMVVVLSLVSGLLLYYNYYSENSPIQSSGSHRLNKDPNNRPRQLIIDEPCEKTFCRWGATCITLNDGRAHCQCPERCPDTQDPVCSTDGRTFQNHCHLRKESCEKRLNSRVRHSGECESQPCDGVQCAWGAQCVEENGRPACKCPKCPTRPPTPPRPACGSDGADYPSACELNRTACEQRNNLSVVYVGKCDPCSEHKCPERQTCQLDPNRYPVCKCGEVCPLTMDPVCGSDGNTYANECELREESCRTRRHMRIIYMGKCSSGMNPCSSVSCRTGEQCWINEKGVAQCGCGPECEPLLKPVCSSDGRTHASPCHLRRAACSEGKFPRVAHHGQCGPLNPCTKHNCGPYGECVSEEGVPRCSCPQCGPHIQPVCATDGRTYSNECKMREKSCQMHATKPPLTLIYNHTCESCEEKKCNFYGVCEIDSAMRAKCVCPHNCTDNVVSEDTEDGTPLPVCGSDGLTYPTECHLTKTACHRQEDITIAYKGDCSLCENVECKYGARCSAGECICPKNCSLAGLEPVCSNTMVTYPNECELQKVACDLPSAHKPLQVIFYGDCKDRFAATGPPIALTTTLPLPFPPTHTGSTLSEMELENSTSLAMLTDYPDLSLSTLEERACKDIHCDFDATCELDSDNLPRCSCIFNCPLDENSEDYFPVCASDMKLYSSMCAMRMEGCHRQKELRLRPLELCKGMEAKPCGGGGTLMLDSLGRELDCGNGPNRQDCPSGSYCHQTISSARCCIKTIDEAIQRKACEEVSNREGSSFGGCIFGCNCHRLGTVVDACDAITRQCPCKPGVGGLRCDRCESGFWGLPRIVKGHKGCIPCGCSTFGSVRDDCEQMTGRCVCKPGIQGQKCTLCTNHQEVLGPNGCYNSETGVLAPKTCDDIECYFGAVCVEKEGRAVCQCSAGSCPTDSTEPTMVCGSDGQTYPSECHLKLQACRTQEDIVVQAFGICKSIEDPTGTAFPSKNFSPLQFTQQDDTNFQSKSTRHLLVPDPRSNNGYYGRGYEFNKERDSTSSLDGDKHSQRNGYRPTPATVRVPPALVGDLCTTNLDCLSVIDSHCDGGACVCKQEFVAALDRRKCLSIKEKDYSTIEEKKPCSSESCMNFGTCIDLPGSTIACICDPQFTGEFCQNTIPLPDIIKYIETPSFSGRSFIRLKTLKAYYKLNIDVQLKTFSENGIILYNQQHADGSGDFVSLALVDGYVEFRYNLGDGIVSLTSHEKLALNEYYTISAKRYHRDGILSIDGMENVIGQSRGSLRALDLVEDTYVGSVLSNFTKVYDNIGTKHGFAGCIKHLRIIRHQVTKKLGREDSAILGMENVRDCSSNPCASLPCHNGATCTVSNEDDTEYECICSATYQGRHCEEKLDPCQSNPCGFDDDVMCESDGVDGYTCKCNYGGKIITDGGIKCSYESTMDKESFIPDFNGSSYLQLPKLDGLGNTFRIEIRFMTRKLSGMLFYNGQSSKGKGDFISLNLVDGYLQFRFNLGSGIANISSVDKIAKDKWHRVRVIRSGRGGMLLLDDLPAVSGQSAPPLTELNLEQPLFLGSLPLHIKPHRLSGVTTSFNGAIQQMFVNSIPLIVNYEDTVPCSMIPNEDVLPCITTGITKYAGFPCSKTANPCQNHGNCIPMLNEYKCVCKDGFKGRNCEIKLFNEMMNNHVPVKFSGETFYAYRNRAGGRRSPGRGIRFELKFRTTESSGLLLWRKKGGVGNGNFLALGIIDGHPELIFSNYESYDLKMNKNERWYSSIRSKVRVDDGLWHTIAIRRRKKMALIQTDNQPSIRGYAQLSLLGTRSNPKIWIGGARSLPHGLPAQLYQTLKGCIASVKANSQHLDLHKPIGKNRNIETC